MSQDPVSESPSTASRPVPRERPSLKRIRRRNPRYPLSSDDEDNIEQTIQATVAKNNLTVTNVRTMINHLVKNPSVLACVQQRADEIDKQLEEQRDIITKRVLTESPDGTMTRNKARSLNKCSLPIPDLNSAEPDVEMAQFIGKDFEEDATDDEYKPGDDEEEDSDEYSTTATCSDIDSQPATPAAMQMIWESEDVVKYDEQGLFKRPPSPVIPKTPGSSTEEIIATRTRSKVSLKTTALETIQGSFVPPDIPHDMYEPEHKNKAWKEFLGEFNKPLNADEEEGEETDPEYVFNDTMGDDNSDVDETYTVSKREVNQLWQELFDLAAANVKMPSNALPAPAECPATQYQQGDPLTEKTESIAVNHDETHQEDDPTYSGINCPTTNQPAPGVDTLAIVSSTPQSNFNLALGSDNRLYLIPSAVLPGNTHQSVVSQVKPKSAYLQVNVNDDLETILSQVQHQKMVYEYESEKESWEIDSWTARGVRIFQRQLLTHIQILGQMFVQTYSHPTLWKEAKKHMAMLEDLSALVTKESKPFLARLCWNLADMMTICQEWEADLNVENHENQDYVRDLVPKVGSCMYGRNVNDRVMERIVSHRAFIFEEYLPMAEAINRDGYKASKNPGSRIILFILCMHECKVSTQKRKRNIDKAINLFQSKYGTGHQGKSSFYHSIKRDKRIISYLRTGVLPTIVVKEVEFDSYDDVVPHADKPRGSLPLFWDTYIFSNRRFKKLYYDPYNPCEKLKQEAEKAKIAPRRPSKVAEITMNFSNFKAQFKLPAECPIYYGVGDDIPDTKMDDFELGDEVEEEKDIASIKQEDLPKRSHEVKSVPKKRNVKSWIRELKDMIRRSLRKQKGRKKKICRSVEEIRTRKRITQKLHQLLTRLDSEYDGNVVNLSPNLISTKIFNYFKEFDIFVRLLYVRVSGRESRTQKDQSIPVVEDKKGIYLWRRGDDADEEPLSSQPEMGMLPKDTMFAWRFVKAAEKQLDTHFHKFVSVLRTLPSAKGAVDFYCKMEHLLLPNHRRLLDILLVFILPLHGAQVGRFIEASIHKNPETCEDNLNVYIAMREHQMKLIYTLLNEMSQEEPAPQRASIKERFLNALDGNQLLTEWFLQLFPTRESSQEDDELMQFWRYGDTMILPAHLYKLMLEEDKVIHVPNLRISASEDGDDDQISDSDSVICMGEEKLPEENHSLYTVNDSRAESDCDSYDDIGIDSEELMPHVGLSQENLSFDLSLGLVEDPDTTDYTE